MRMKIAIGSDHYGYPYKEMIKTQFAGFEFTDVGTYTTDPVTYPGIGEKAANLVASGECRRGILICGTGIGMSITANKVPGCYAAVCHDIYSTERSILSNNANIMCMGALVIGRKTCETLTKIWLDLIFDKKSHSKQNVDMINEIESKWYAKR